MQMCHWAPSQLAGWWVRTRCSWTTGASPPNVLWSSGNRLRLSDRPPRVILAAIPPTETETFVTHRRANDWNSEEEKTRRFILTQRPECVCAQKCALTFGSPAGCWAVKANKMPRLLSVFLRRLNVQGRSTRPATRVIRGTFIFTLMLTALPPSSNMNDNNGGRQ